MRYTMASSRPGETHVYTPTFYSICTVHRIECHKSEWEHAMNSLGWDSSEGGWQGEVIDTWELLEYTGLIIHEDSHREDILNALGMDTEWCRKDPYGETEDEGLYFDWMYFCEYVKHENRYFFHQVSIESDRSLDARSYAAEILFFLGKIVTELGMIKTVQVGSVFFRGRINDNLQPYTSVTDLGPVPKNKAVSSNRMSATGIPMFYGAEDRETVLAEIATGDEPLDASIGVFRTLRTLRVLDLVEMPKESSLFDPEKRRWRGPIIFLNNFVRDISKPVEKDGKEHLEYVPTQVVAEYFRYAFRLPGGERLDGILYPSTRRPGGKHCVLFLTQKDCTGNLRDPKLGEKALLLASSERMIHCT
ncbi:HEPN-associated N-terminal domain-containing protein [Kyrpidia tusciae]|uniref:RES domain protein n=1 Tax=Kyrpidia tusciae (strain DSM 2912 / NBRC 15312 / T2) TaxID=562970 RepID=D5WVR4_KYRT2|nr:HEPN-associated N-terminal domain-containing protein [Kyrpidia tusciae]ADG07607.1 RES domain protein [Kyrpidia tusciae DSM 2912]